MKKAIISVILLLVLFSINAFASAGSAVSTIPSLSGEGTSIIENITIQNAPVAVVFQPSEYSTFEVSYSIENDKHIWSLISESQSEPYFDVLTDSGTYTFYIETDKPWEMSFLPIDIANAVSSLDFSGTSSGVTGLFTFSKPIIVHLSANYSQHSVFMVDMYTKPYGGPWLKDKIAYEYGEVNESESISSILKYADLTSCFFVVNSPYGTWTISDK